MREKILKVKKELNDLLVDMPQTEEQLHESLERIAKRMVGKIKICLQGFNNEDFNINIVSGRDPYQGITLDVDIQEFGEWNRTNLFKICYHKYRGLEFTWKFIDGYHQTEKNKLSLDVLNFLTTSKFFQHLLEKLDTDLRDVFDKRLHIKETTDEYYELRRNAVETLHQDMYHHLLSGELYESTEPILLTWGVIDFPFTKIHFVRTPKKRSGKLYVTTSAGDDLLLENVTLSRLEAISRAIILHEI